jgi:hypothetical protein
MNSYPADEQRISEIERGRSCTAILPMPAGKMLSPGDQLLFALAYSNTIQGIRYVQGGDSVCVSLTDVTDLGITDPASGQALFRFSWKPLGQIEPVETTARRGAKSRGARGPT